MWDTDELFALQAAAAKLTGVDPATAEFEQLVSLRILADHARSTSLLVSDGVFPSNEARGYVLRRILRRAVRHAYILGVESAVMGGLVDAVFEIMGADYPDLAANHQFVREVIDREEVRFRETLRKGQAILDEQLDALADGAALPGDVAFLLHDTYGFPLEVTQEITGERGVEVDVEGFQAAMAEQQRQAKEARKVAAVGDTAHLTALVDKHGETDFTGRDQTSSEATVLYVDDDTLVLDRTPFYAESGGQIGDTGTVTGGGVTSMSPTPGMAYRESMSTRSPAPAASRRARSSPPPSTTTDVRRSGATTPPPTSSTGRCGGCLAITSSSRAPMSARIGCASTSATTRG